MGIASLERNSVVPMFRKVFQLCLIAFPVLSGFGLVSSTLGADLKVVVVVGAEGESEYGEDFRKRTDLWRSAASKGGADFHVIGMDGKGAGDREKVEKVFSSTENPELWMVLIGHGTYDGRTAKFNLRGPDFTDEELGRWADLYEGEFSLINTASASGSFIKSLAGPNRVVITATKSASEIYYSRFGIYFTEAITGKPEADLDNDDQVSLLEAFLFAASEVSLFFEKEGRLATEHSVMDDNGDGIGSRPEWFEGTTAVQVANEKSGPDGERAQQKVLVRNDFERNLTIEQRRSRDELEREVRSLRREKEDLAEELYYTRLEEILLKIAKIYGEVKSDSSGIRR